MRKTGAPRQRPPIDWTDVRHRLERLDAAVARGWRPLPEEQRQILAARAAALARPLAAPAAGEQLEILEFSLGGEHYGFLSGCVREVLHLTELTRLPCTPAFVRGIVNVRGEIVSVIDLRRLFDLPAGVPGERDRVVVLHSPDMCFGVLAHRIVGVLAVARPAIQPLPALPQRGWQDCLLGLVDDRVILLDGARLLADRRLVVQESVAG